MGLLAWEDNPWLRRCFWQDLLTGMHITVDPKSLLLLNLGPRFWHLMPASDLQEEGGPCPTRGFRKKDNHKNENQPSLAFIPGDVEKSSVLKAMASTLRVLSQIIV
uniref:Uncharacterized protein n=1 Tax=Micrurus corallinus TaxID=54390 RepID=A0A2D4EP57_MICCO